MNGKNTNQKKRELASSISMGIQPNPLDCRASFMRHMISHKREKIKSGIMRYKKYRLKDHLHFLGDAMINNKKIVKMKMPDVKAMVFLVICVQ